MASAVQTLRSDPNQKSLIDPNSAPLSEEDWRILGQVESSLDAGVQVHKWWKKKDAEDKERRLRNAGSAYDECFDLVRTFNPGKRAFAFFDQVALSNPDVQVKEQIPLVGVVQEMTFDYSRGDPEDNRDQIRQFVMRYLLRVSDYSRPDVFIAKTKKRTKEEAKILDGWGYSQVYYKLKASGAIGKFPEERQAQIVNMEEVGVTYEWLVLNARFFNILMSVPRSGTKPHLQIPFYFDELVVTSADLIVNVEKPEPGVLARYGYGCAPVRNVAPEEGTLVWGPGRFYPCYSALLFEVRCSGETIVTCPFAANRPDRVFGLSPFPAALATGAFKLMTLGLPSGWLPALNGGVDPVLTPVELLNRATGQIPAKHFGISKDAFVLDLMLEHFSAVYQLLSGAALTYCMVEDWTAPESSLPRWVQTGVVE